MKKFNSTFEYYKKIYNFKLGGLIKYLKASKKKIHTVDLKQATFHK